MESLTAENRVLVDRWLGWDHDPQSRDQVMASLRSTDEQATLLKALSSRIAFGTAGLRGRMAPGFANMNDVTVLQAAQGLCRYLEAVEPDLKMKGIVVGHDHRHHSQRFADLTAAVFVSQGVRVHFFSVLVPTPFVPYAINVLSAAAGVMVTASHNPKDDNGYKVYWGNGCQITEPHDKGIANCISENQAPWDGIYDSVKANLASPLISDPTDGVDKAYYEAISQRFCWHREENKESKTKIVFTPMHGVGKVWAAKAFDAFNLPMWIGVEEQLEPHPDFPTVPFPNPEEGQGALKLAMETAEKSGARIIIANDPDSDRCAAAERQESGEWKIFTGNEIGILFAAWIWEHYRIAQPDADPSKCVMLNTTVSSKMLSSMASHEGFKYEETLTGFKWLGNKAYQLMKEGYNFLYAFEEAIGYLIGDISLDKDGIRAAPAFAEMASTLNNKGMSVTQYLYDLYAKYGYYATQNKYFFCNDPVVMQAIFTRMRNGGQYFPAAGPFKITHIRDLTTGYDSRMEDKKPILPVSSSTHMITFYFENGTVATLRGSGTEPKLKYYCELSKGSAANEEERSAVRKELNDVVQAIITDFLQPESNGLLPPAD